MRLYHFTDARLLRTILRQGLKPGSEPMPPKHVVWFDRRGVTPNSPRRLGHNLCRLTVVIPDWDRCLVKYNDWLRRNMQPSAPRFADRRRK
jgi:hypothetical protein